MNFLKDILRFRVDTTPDRVAVSDWDTRIDYTWRDLDRRARALARALQGCGVKKGDRVGFVCQTHIALFDALYAASLIGAVITTYNGRLIAREIAAQVARETPRIVLYSPCYVGKIDALREAAGPETRFVCLDEAASISDPVYEAWVADHDSGILREASVDEDDPLMLIHTGGTTGTPKAAIHTHRAVFLSAINVVVAWKLTRADSAYICMPFFHVGGWNCPAIGMMMVGATIIIAREFSSARVLDITESVRPTFLFATEAMLRAIALDERFEGVDFSCYRWLMAGGSPLSAVTLEPFWERGVRVFNGYGMTEVVSYVLSADTSASLEENCRKPDTVGKPLPFSQVRVVNEQGADTVPMERGELVVGGEAVFSGYWHAEPETAVAVRDGWIHTGDIAYRDEDGDFFICGRSKDMFISGGENVFPVEVENALLGHPAIRACAVIGVADAMWGEVGKAFIELHSGCNATARELDAWLEGRLSTIKRPKSYVFVDAIPTTAAGKKDLAALRKLAEEGRGGLPR